MKSKLLLFDIDGTLMDTRGAGAGALFDAAEEVLKVRREDLPPLDLAGATDAGVIKKLFIDAGRPLESDRVNAFRDVYLERLRERMHHESFVGSLLPGVVDLLDGLVKDGRFVMGLLTGNVRRGADIKLERFDIARHFLDGGFGDDAEHRNDIGPIAVQRLSTAIGRAFAGEDVVVIGDTPKDIACAEAIGARCIAVATGRFSADELRSHPSATVVNDLADTGQFMRLLE